MLTEFLFLLQGSPTPRYDLGRGQSLFKGDSGAEAGLKKDEVRRSAKATSLARYLPI